ncbi:espin-like protein [Denticeps clupeoides]|uniref:espin-like protein n=1 Tax=Denticeps clupeoides TaxID=299321 RepID=UPI0010A42518|nr:espin-like protein [Denticeps clupeoides]
MESGKPVKQVPPQPRSCPSSPVPTFLSPPSTHQPASAAATGSFQQVQVASTVVNTFSKTRSPEEESSLLFQMKSMRSLKHAGITAVFTGQSVNIPKGENDMVVHPNEEACLTDIDCLVPTHDANGQPIAEWKRQVMVHKLQSRLWNEEDQDQKGSSIQGTDLDGWKYSHVHAAILGPFGELLTKDDLTYLEEQIENVSLQKRCQAYELELARLTEELRSLLPAPIVNITVNTQFLHEQPPGHEGPLPLPVWCSRISGIVKSMTLILNNITGREDDEEPGEMVVASPPRHQNYSRREKIEREIQLSGVSVRTLRSNFENQVDTIYPFAGIMSKASAQHTNEHQLSTATHFLEVKGHSVTKLDTGIDHNTTLSGKCNAPIMESTTLRKERIVVLFLSHWKKSAYAISLKTKMRASFNNYQTNECTSMAATQHRQTSLGYFCTQMIAIDKMIKNWRAFLTGAPLCHFQSLNRKQTIYSPEQFLPFVDGAPVPYDGLTLDLFMLGYFHILEQELPSEERKMRHLLCFEVFDHVGSFPWETVRDFHKTILQEIQAGKRQWKDGFEDIKAQFFGREASSDLCSSSSSHHRVVVENTGHGPTWEKSNNTEFLSYNNDEICRYINRSFAFWKEKEAELFDF